MISFLVAFRDDGERAPLWDLIRAKLETTYPDDEIVVACDDGIDPFHKTLALNRAAAAAAGDVLCVWDADTWLDPASVLHGAAQVAAGGWAKPWSSKLKLNEAATRHVLGLGPSWDGTLNHRPFGAPENHNTYWAGPPILVHRAAWEAVGGNDERFRGWGSEDESFALSLKVVVGAPSHAGRRGMALHLWHPRRGKSGSDLWVGQDSSQENAELGRRYRCARTVEHMRALIAERSVHGSLHLSR